MFGNGDLRSAQVAPPRPGGRTTIDVGPNRRVTVRYLTPADGELLVDLYYHLSPETIRRRFFRPAINVSPEMVRQEARKLARTDPCRELALVATAPAGRGESAIAVVRIACDPDHPGQAEVAIVVRDDCQCEGLGTTLFRMIAAAARERGIRTFHAHILSDNHPCLQLLKKCGLPYTTHVHHGEMEVEIQVV